MVRVGSDVVNLEDHLAQLYSQHDLSPLGRQGLQHILFLHVCKRTHSGNEKHRIRSLNINICFLWDEGKIRVAMLSCLTINIIMKSKCYHPQMKWHDLPLVPLLRQSIPRRGLFSVTCRDLTSASVWMGDRPLFSASASGTLSRAEEKDLIAYCSSVEICKGGTNKCLSIFFL